MKTLTIQVDDQTFDTFAAWMARDPSSGAPFTLDQQTDLAWSLLIPALRAPELKPFRDMAPPLPKKVSVHG